MAINGRSVPRARSIFLAAASINARKRNAIVQGPGCSSCAIVAQLASTSSSARLH